MILNHLFFHCCFIIEFGAKSRNLLYFSCCIKMRQVLFLIRLYSGILPNNRLFPAQISGLRVLFLFISTSVLFLKKKRFFYCYNITYAMQYQIVIITKEQRHNSSACSYYIALVKVYYTKKARRAHYFCASTHLSFSGLRHSPIYTYPFVI